MNYKQKYLKYKLKYLTAKKLYGGMHDGDMSPIKMFLETLPDKVLEDDMSEFSHEDYNNMQEKMHKEIEDRRKCERKENSKPVAHVDAGKQYYNIGLKEIFGINELHEEAVANTFPKSILPFGITNTIEKLTKKETMTHKEKETLITSRDSLAKMYNSIIDNTNINIKDKILPLQELKEWIDHADKYI